MKKNRNSDFLQNHQSSIFNPGSSGLGINKFKEKEIKMKILVGYDGSNVAKEAIAIAEKHANAFKAEIILVHSMVGGPEVPRKDFENAEKDLDY